MSETKKTQENETNREIKYYISGAGPHIISVEGRTIRVLVGKPMRLPFRSGSYVYGENEIFVKLTNKEENSQVTLIPLQIDVEPLTPQTLALVFSALTELTTKLWLISQHRFADLIEYNQTHDARFADEAGVNIAYVTYNSPFSFGFNVDLSATNVADATITIVDGLAQRKAKREQLDINNQATAQKIKEAEEALKQQQDMAELEREKREIELEKLRLENQKESQALTEQRLESQIKQFEYALEFASKAIDIVYPNTDPEIRPLLIQTIVNNILQLDSVEGLRLALPEHRDVKPPTTDDAKTNPTKDHPETKEDAEQ